MDFAKRVFSNKKALRVMCVTIGCCLACWVTTTFLPEGNVATSLVFLCCMGAMVSCHEFSKVVRELQEAEDSEI